MRSRTSAASQVDARRRQDPQPGVRHHAAPLYRGHHHRARDRPRSVLDVAARRLRRPDGCILLAIETSCDETAAAVIAETGDAGRPWELLSNVIASQADSTASGAASSPSSRPGSTCATSAASSIARWSRHASARRIRRGRGHARARPRGLAAGRRGVRQGGSMVARNAADSRFITWPAISNRWSCSTAKCRCRRPCSSSPAATRASYLVEASRAISAARPHARRCGGGGVRQGRQAARPRLPGGPVIDRLARKGDDRRIAAVPRMTHADRNAPTATAPPGCYRRRSSAGSISASAD